MKRLVYSPKAFVYVMNDQPPPDAEPGANGGPFLHNISDLVVSGNVARKLNQVSTAEIVFRNPNRIYTQAGNPTFRPMDAITIFLQRLPGWPVQVFTGYLDETPYYQMYPGTATLRASCTLKRLQYKYFDPGLPFMTTFLAKFGWTYDPSSGGAINTHKFGDSVADTSQDANLSELIFAVMQYIGEWRPEDIYVERLPQRLLDRIVALYNTISEQNQEATTEFEDFLKNFVGTGGADSGTSDSSPATGGPAAFRKAANKWGDKTGVDPSILMGIAETETNFGANNKTSSAGAKGFMQFMPATRQQILDKYHVDAYGSVSEAVHAAALLLIDYGYKKSVHDAIFGYNHSEEYVATVMANASKYKSDSSSSNSSSSNSKHDSQEPTTSNADTQKNAHGNKSSSTSGTYVNPIGKGLTAGRTDQGTDWGGTGPVYAIGRAKVISVGLWNGWPGDGGLVYQLLEGHRKNATVFIMEDFNPNPNLKPGKEIQAGEWVGSTHAGSSGIEMGWANDSGTAPLTQYNGSPDGTPMSGGKDFKAFVDNLSKGGQGTDPTGGSSSSGGSSGDNALAAAKAAGLLTTFQFPGSFDAAESVLLKGDKSLMNDQPLLPFIQELCQGSMRSFMSLPNGDFYAFNPDYFGSFEQQPYWEIDDLEIIEGNIQLTDDALATHVYVVGATLPDQQIEITRRLTTAGVVNVFNAGTADFLNIPAQATDAPGQKSQNTSQPFLGTMANTLQFLDKYGARPYVNESTAIRSHIFETFYAFQTFMLMWARQFLTPFQFTFMPELYPGGIVAFPSHGIQCFIEEVNHSFDYASGFTTTANLSAPSAKDNRLVSSGMVRAGIEGASPAKPSPSTTPTNFPQPAPHPGTRGDLPT